MTDASIASRPLALVTGASSGIGYELAKLCAQEGFNLVIAADRPAIVEAAQSLSNLGACVRHLLVDLSDRSGVDRLCELIGGDRLDCLIANAGQGLGGAFLDQGFDAIEDVIDTNVVGTLYLLHRLAPRMRDAGRGRILITGSIAGLMPGSFQAVYNGSKAFVDSFAWALRNELKDSGVTVTCLMPGPTDTAFFERAGLEDTQVGQGRKDDPADVAKTGFHAMMKGEGDVIPGVKNKLQAAMAAITPQSALAERHRQMTEPGSGAKS